MKNRTRLSKLICGILLACVIGLSGCVSMPANVDNTDGYTVPNYALIEFGSVAVFTVIVNEVNVPQETVVQAYDAFSHVESLLLCVGETCPPVDLSIIDNILAARVPIEYSALTKQGMALIRQEIGRYMPLEIPMEVKSDIATRVTLSVISGAKAALAPYIKQ